MQYQRQRNLAQMGSEQVRNHMAPIYGKENLNNSLSIQDSREFQFFDQEQNQMQYNGYKKDIYRTSFVQSPINKIKSEITIKQNYNPFFEKDNEQDLQVRELTNILNQQHNKIKAFNMPGNDNSGKKINTKFGPQYKFQPSISNQYSLERKNEQTNYNSNCQIQQIKKQSLDFDLQKKYAVLKSDYQRLELQYRKAKGQIQHLKTQKSNLMNDNIQNTKKLSHKYQQNMAELNQTIQQLEAKVYQLQMGDIISNSTSFNGRPNSQTARNSNRQKHQNGLVSVNPFYLQELQKNNEHLKRQNTRLNEVLMQKMRNSFKNMY